MKVEIHFNCIVSERFCFKRFSASTCKVFGLLIINKMIEYDEQFPIITNYITL